MLYEIRPDLFPEGMLTDCEIILWSRHFEATKANGVTSGQ
jgi:hypothetical protein